MRERERERRRWSVVASVCVFLLLCDCVPCCGVVNVFCKVVAANKIHVTGMCSLARYTVCTQPCGVERLFCRLSLLGITTLGSAVCDPCLMCVSPRFA